MADGVAGAIIVAVLEVVEVGLKPRDDTVTTQHRHMAAEDVLVPRHLRGRAIHRAVQVIKINVFMTYPSELVYF